MKQRTIKDLFYIQSLVCLTYILAAKLQDQSICKLLDHGYSFSSRHIKRKIQNLIHRYKNIRIMLGFFHEIKFITYFNVFPINLVCHKLKDNLLCTTICKSAVYTTIPFYNLIVLLQHQQIGPVSFWQYFLLLKLQFLDHESVLLILIQS